VGNFTATLYKKKRVKDAKLIHCIGILSILLIKHTRNEVFSKHQLIKVTVWVHTYVVELDGPLKTSRNIKLVALQVNYNEFT